MVEWTPEIVVLLTAMFGFCTYLFQKYRDRKEDLIKIRRAEYRKWIQSLYEILAADKPNALLQFNSNTNDLFLYASDEVVRCVGTFTTYMSRTSGNAPRDMKQVGMLLSKVVKAMRKDVFVSTRLDENTIRNMLPVQGAADDE